MRIKGQTAIEFLTTYSFTLLIIALVLFMLLLYASLPKTTLPLQCTFYGGFNCLDVVYYNTSAGGSQLIVLASDIEPGTVVFPANTNNFVVNMINSNYLGGFCVQNSLVPNSLPNIAMAGQTVYCVANFSSSATMGYIYTATFHISAKYCANAPSSLSSSNCTTYATYAGEARTEGTICTNSITSKAGLNC
jgi:hypothetical protein